jgi:uncharacterized protein (DUF885 family)
VAVKVKTLFKWTGIGLGAVAFLGGSFAGHEWYADKPFLVNDFYNREFIKTMLESPEGLTANGLFRQIPLLDIDGYDADWDDGSIAGQDRQFAMLDKATSSLALYREEDLDEQELITRKIVMELFGDPERMKKFRYHNYPVNQLFGMQNEVPRFLDTFHQVSDRDDAEHYITRLSKIDIKFAQNMEGLVKRESLGIIPPTFVIDKVIDGMKGFVATPAEENILYVSFRDKLDMAGVFSAEDRERFLTQAAAEVSNSVYPAYQSYIDYFTRLRDKSNNDAGVWKFPDGKAFYDYMLRVSTTTSLTADEIHRIGLQEVARIKSEMVAIFVQEGYDTTKGFSALINELPHEERFYYADTDEGREQILKDYGVILDEIRGGLDGAFRMRPRASLEVKRVPEFSEKTAPAAYYNGPDLGGSRPGTFYANLYDIKVTPKYGMRTLAYHEGIPGHHFQVAIQNELEGLPMLRTQVSFTPYDEGWGLYAERLAWELGFEKDPYDNLGRLRDEMLRAVRLVVDTGIHAKRWSREQAIEYMQANTGIAESDVVSEIERYIVMPGQATAYMVGMMEILRLREEARAALGPRFDLRDFHDVVLKNGAVPLNLLRELVYRYIEEKKAS